MTSRTLWTNARLPGMAALQQLAVGKGRIAAIGPDLPRADAEVVDLEGRLLLPAFVDCHTHLIHGGNRSGEFEMRLEGASYQQIAQAGGGIVATMRATRALDAEGLAQAALPRLDALLAEGVSTVEIKSGYGLTIESELTMLRAARRLAELRPFRLRTSWLAAHALPPEYAGRKADYIREVAIAGLEAAHAEGLVDAVDAFCEGIAFSAPQIEPLFARAAELGLPVKLHTEQLTRSGGAQMAARHGALSVEHFEYGTADDVAALAQSGSVAVLLPGAFYMLNEVQKPPVAALRAAGVPMALSTDCNPGTSPVTSMLTVMNLAAVLWRMTVQECLDGVTCHAARALGLQGVTGRLAPGLSADFTVWDAERPAELVGRLGLNPLNKRVFQGVVTHG